jgi:hypothetical protein
MQAGAYLREYLEYGGFPEVVLSGEKREILFRFYADVLHRDLLRRHKIRKPQEMQALIKYLMSNVASLISYQAVARALGVSVNTVKKFTGFLEQAYLVYEVKRFSWKVKEQEQSPRKVYALDTGLCNIVGFRFSEQPGRLAENLVFSALMRRQILDPAVEIFYWKDAYHHEVDFVVKKGMDVSELIQVCWNVDDERTRKRETRSLLKAMDLFALKEGIIVNDSEERVDEFPDGKRIQYVSLRKFL